MGGKGSWISAVKKALTPDSKDKKDKKSRRSKSRWFGRQRSRDQDPSPQRISVVAPATPPTEEPKCVEGQNKQHKHAYSVALATAAAAEAAIAAAQAAAEVVRLTTLSRYTGISKEEAAAIKIQTAFRGYLARRAVRALRGLMRLKSLVQGKAVKRQAATTLRCMQTLARVQSQIHARRIRMSEENLALQQQLEQKRENEDKQPHQRLSDPKRENEVENSRASGVGGNWNASTQSKEQVEAKVQSRLEAATRRERALAYAYTHQKMRKNSSKSSNQTFMDPNTPQWGWSWLERWMAARPWETRTARETNLSLSLSVLNSSPNSTKPNRLLARPAPSSPSSKAPSVASIVTKRSSTRGSSYGGDNDSVSSIAVRSNRIRRHSFAASSMTGEESLTSLTGPPSYMVPTRVAKAGSRGPSLLGSRVAENGPAGSAKKWPSFPSPGGTRRHSVR